MGSNYPTRNCLSIGSGIYNYVRIRIRSIMPPGLKKEKKYLDGELCFRTWINCGSVGKTVKILHSQGVVNPNTGKPPTHMGVWGSAWMWMFDNMVEAKKLTAEAWLANGELLTDEKWCRMVVSKTRILSKGQYERFMSKHSYLRPYIGK